MTALPELLVEQAFTVTPTLGTSESGSTFVLDDAVRGELDDVAIVLAGDVWVDVTADVVEMRTSRGRNRDLDSFEVGQCTVTLRNDHRDYDPTNLSSPYYPGVRPRRAIAITAVVGIDVYPIFTGFTDDSEVEDDGFTGSTCEVPASDAFAVVAVSEVDATVVSETTGVRIETILAEAEVNYGGLTSIAAGLTTCAAGTAGGNTLEYLRKIERTEQGYLYVSRDGVLTFRDRHAPATAPTSAVFSDDDTGITYEKIKVGNGITSVYNRIKATRESGTQQVAADATSQDEYFTRELSLADLKHTSDAEVLSLAQFVLGRHKDPVPAPRAVRVNLALLTEAQQRAVLGLELTDAVTVQRTPPGSSLVEHSCLIDSIGHSHDPEHGHWSIVFGLSPIDDRPVFILDHAALGVLDTGILAY